jgi:hypothetical protein
VTGQTRISNKRGSSGAFSVKAITYGAKVQQKKARPSFLKKRSKKLFSVRGGLNRKGFLALFFKNGWLA